METQDKEDPEWLICARLVVPKVKLFVFHVDAPFYWSFKYAARGGAATKQYLCNKTCEKEARKWK